MWVYICFHLDLSAFRLKKNTVMKLVFALVLQEIHEDSTRNLEMQVVSSHIYHV